MCWPVRLMPSLCDEKDSLLFHHRVGWRQDVRKRINGSPSHSGRACTPLRSEWSRTMDASANFQSVAKVEAAFYSKTIPSESDRLRVTCCIARFALRRKASE